jgi:amino acid transporter
MATSVEGSKPAIKVFVATTVMLTFISFWRASAIVLSDLASSAYYAGGDAEKVIGKSAPWFILAVMLFSYCVRALYIESSSMFVRGGVYRVVKEAMGGGLAKFSVSALLFDYVLTGPISAVSAGQYLAGFIKDIGVYLHRPLNFSDDHFAAGLAVIVVAYFWRKNTQGMHESSQKALQIMAITSVMVVILLIWCTITVLRAPVQLPPNPVRPDVIPLNKESLGWLNGTWFGHITWIILFVGFGHSVLAMSGEETLAQVNREIEHPKLKNLEKTGLVIFIYSLLFTSLVSFFAVMIIPDKVRPDYFANLIGGIAMYLVGPTTLKLIFHGFVVLVGVLILAAAQNTSIVGANGVLNRVAEDGVLTSWFQKPHNRYGTSYRIINLIVALQLLKGRIEWMKPLPPGRYEFYRKLYEKRAATKDDPDDYLPERVGLQPYITMEIFDRLKAGFREYRRLRQLRQPTGPVERAIVFYAGWLGHYVADGSQPLHTTVSYNGWVGPNPNHYTTQPGIHWRFEGPYVAANIQAKDFGSMVHAPERLADPFRQYLEYLEASHALVEKVYALDKAGGFTGKGSPEALAFTEQRLAAGTQMLLNLWYTAWLDSAIPRTGATCEEERASGARIWWRHKTTRRPKPPRAKNCR